MKKSALSIAFVSFFLWQGASAQQNLTTPRSSQAASVSQRIGLTDITVNYSSPLVRGRHIFGALVPYDQVWRCGANENTTVSFSTDVKVEGKDLKAGTYGLHMIPTANEWTIIFSSDHNAWGSFAYTKDHDVLRVTTKPVETEFHECLTYEFPVREADKTVLSLKWDKLEVPIHIEIDLHTTILNQMQTELTGLPQFSWQGWNQIASYCAVNKIRQQDALGWVDQSIGLTKNFTNLMTKSMLLEQTGKPEEAKKLKDEALPMGTETEVNQYGNQLMGLKKFDDAITVFAMNTKKHPESWNVWDSLADGYDNKGDKANAIKYYKKAHDMAPDNQKPRIKSILDRLQQ
ncbi:MAG: DUF2911 domain-containing protein [Flavobacteriales bacterium]|nr:DUF2911 domain-containing protein [Flavobacteriales bacterium]MCB9447985.1 DUF2911 domain-containing protein [Flavobacteriales bacterium]